MSVACLPAKRRLASVALSRRHSATGPLRVAPVEHIIGWREERRDARRAHLATATLACPECDAPVAPPGGPVSITRRLACPFCGLAGAVRDFLTLDSPVRPARVDVWVVLPRAASRTAV